MAASKEYHKNWYLKNRSKRVEQQRTRKAEHIARVAEIKESQPCTDCGNFYPFYVMDFDHITQDKLNTISRLVNYKWERIQKEIDKCELVCSNCHRIRTYSRLRGETGTRDSAKVL